MWIDLRIAIRTLARTPGFTAIAVLVLGLAIGGVTAMFTLVNAIALRPLSANQPRELVRFYSHEIKPDPAYRGFSYPNYIDLREQNQVCSSVAASTFALVGVEEGDLTRRSFAALVSANYFSTFGVALQGGREFLPEEEEPGSAIPVAIVSHGYWRRSGADPDLVGRPIHINARRFEVIGIAPEGFTGTTALFSPEFWLPLGMYEQVVNDFANARQMGLRDRNHHALLLVGRLKSGLTPATAEPSVAALAQRLAETHPDVNREHTIELAPPPRFSMSTYRDNDTWNRTLSLLLMGMSGVVLLIACLNLANMLLARGASRQKEMAVRLSLGARRGQIIRQLLMEGLVLSVLGGAAGLLLASWSSRLLMASLAPKLPFVSLVFDARPDGRVLLATALVCGLSTLLFALLPALRLARTELVNGLKLQCTDSLRGPSRGLFTARNSLVIVQIALSLALLTSAGLFHRGAFNALRANPGFSLDDGIVVEVDAALAGYDEARARQLYPAVVERLRSLPGIESASLAYIVPFGIVSDGRRVRPAGAGMPSDAAARDSDQQTVSAGFNIIGTDYFRTIGLPLLRGREFDRLEIESTNTARVAIIDLPLAERLWPGLDPIGRSIEIADTAPDHAPSPIQVVGVVAGVRNELGDQNPQPHLYVPFGQEYRSMMNLHLRARQLDAGSEASLLTAARQAIRSVDDRLPVLSVQTLRRAHTESIFLWILKTGARLFTLFGGLAMLLAVMGVYGVKAYVVASRTREWGIRIALGASSRSVRWMVVRDGLKVTMIGLGTGLALAVGVGFLLRGFLYDVQAVDPWIFTIVPALLATATLFASYLPARHATKIDPMIALRSE
jgi:predicted permease